MKNEPVSMSRLLIPLKAARAQKILRQDRRNADISDCGPS
jgi:hypothetical protein